MENLSYCSMFMNIVKPCKQEHSKIRTCRLILWKKTPKDKNQKQTDLLQCSYEMAHLITLSTKIFGVTNFRTKTCPKIYLYEIWYCPKICHAENFFTDMRMRSVK